jgi:hypothetical protein
VTRYTSMVAVEQFVSSLSEPERCEVQSMLPRGSNRNAFLGQGGTLRPAVRLAGLILLTLGGVLVLLRKWV